jgi:hypothetical protein
MNPIDTKEEFCGACVAGAVALVGAAGAGAGAGSKKMHKKTKKILLITGVSTFFIAVAISIYVWKNNCGECR